MRRVGVLEPIAVDDPEALTRVTAFAQGLQQLGWTASRNVRSDYRWGAGDADRIRKQAAELAALAPNAILTAGASTTAPMLRATRTVPVVFVSVVDPVGAGYVDSLARPGGNVTGFTSARLLRNKFGHDFGPTNVGRMFEHAFLIPKKVAFLGCRENVLAYLKQNFG